MATRNLDEKKSKAHELEIARRFRKIIEGLPVVAMNNFLTNLCEAISLGNVEESGNLKVSRRPWEKKSINQIHFPTPPEISVEVLPYEEKYKERFDLVVPIPSISILEIVATSLIFEFKLGRRDSGQLRKYCLFSPNSIIISVSIDSDETGPIESHSDGKGRAWIHQTWEHLYFALQSILSGDAEPRITKIEEPGDLVLKFGHKVAGQDRLAFAIESFLELVLERNLLPNRSLTLVVPIGHHAEISLNNPAPYYAHSDRWRAGYRYLVAIKGNVVQAIYSVIESVTTERTDIDPPVGPSGLDSEIWNQLCEGESLRVSLLKNISNNSECKSFIKMGYYNPGPRGRPRTFTQTHRYLEKLTDLSLYFTKSNI